MRILNVNTTLDSVSGGGTAERTYQMSRFLARAGNDCAILTLDVGLAPERIAALHPVKVTALRCVMPRFYLFPLPEPRINDLVRWADVVHLMGHWTVLNALVYRAVRKLRKPYVVCPAGALRIYGRSHALKCSYNWIVGRKIVRDAGACVAIANNEIAQFAEYGVPAEHVAVIPNGIDPEDFSNPNPDGFRAKFRLPGVPFILFMGRLNPIKGPDLLLRAFAEARLAGRGYHLVFAGPDGGLLDTLKMEAARVGVEKNVHFLGYVGAQDKVSAYRASEMLVIPSRQEAMSIVVLEAGACDCPVLITDRCGFDEVERIGGGRVVPSSADGIKAGLLELLGDATGLRAMGKKLGEFVHRNFLWEITCERYLDLFSRLLHGKEQSA